MFMKTTKCKQKHLLSSVCLSALLLMGILATACEPAVEELQRAAVTATSLRSPLQPPPIMTRPRANLSPLSTPTAPVLVRTPIPTGTPMVVPPPPGYPTDQPWPPPPATLLPTVTPQPFPAPAFRPMPTGKRPDQMQSLWFPYFPDAGRAPQLREVLIDQKGQRWEQTRRLLNLALPKPQLGPDPGSVLVDLHISPNHRWLAADFAYMGSQLIDMSSGKSQALTADSSVSSWNFLTWHPDGQHVLVASNTELLLVNLDLGKYEAADLLPKSGFDSPYINGVSYSPDGVYVADAVIYPATYQVRNVEVSEIGLRDTRSGERKPIVQIPGGINITEHSLRWSPDGRRFAWIVNAVSDGTTTTLKLADVQSQLWVAKPTKGSANMLGILGKSVEYLHSAIWSPDGRYIAAVKVEGVRDGKDVSNNIYLFDPELRTERQVTRFTNWRLSHLAWSPDGQWLAFTVSRGKYGEIWVTNLDGTQQYPLAGPTMPDAPFVWLP